MERERGDGGERRGGKGKGIIGSGAVRRECCGVQRILKIDRGSRLDCQTFVFFVMMDACPFKAT